MKKFELFYWSPMYEKWYSWAIVREEELEKYLIRWSENEEADRFGELKCKEVLNFGEGLYKVERMRDLRRYVRAQPW
jgi:hypothetical protein